MSTGEILLLGDINIDTFWPVSDFPVPGRDGLVDEVKFEIGGAVLNSAVLLDRLGMNTRLLGCIGRDRWADIILDTLVKSKINLSSVQVDHEAMTGINFTIVTPDGERTMFTHRGANVKQKPENLDESVFKKAAILHISGYALLESPQRDTVWKAVELAKHYNLPISLDTGLEPVIKRPEDFRILMKELTICVSGPEEIALLLGSHSPEEAADKLIALGIKLAAIKLGGKGSLIASKADSLATPCFEVETVDSTGAGDSFSAGILYGWLNGLNLEETATIASALGALATTVYGAGASLPDKNKIIQFFQEVNDIPASFMESSIRRLIEHLKSA